MNRYFKDCNDVIHVRDLRGDAEYTLCGFAWDSLNNDDDRFNDIPMNMNSNGPSNCLECKEAYNEIKKSLKGIKWSKSLK